MISFEEFNGKYESELKKDIEDVCSARSKFMRQEVAVLILSILIFILFVNLIDFSARKSWLDDLIAKDFFKRGVLGICFKMSLQIIFVFLFDIILASLISGYLVYNLLIITKIVEYISAEEYNALEKKLAQKIMKEFYVEVDEVNTDEKAKIKELNKSFGLSWDSNIYLHGEIRGYSMIIEKETIVEILTSSSFVKVKLNNVLPFEAKVGHKCLVAGMNLVQVKGENIREVFMKWLESLKCNIRYDYTTQEGQTFLKNYIFNIIGNEIKLRKKYKISFLTDKLIITRTGWIFPKSLKERLSAENIYNDIKCLNDVLDAYETYINRI